VLFRAVERAPSLFNTGFNPNILSPILLENEATYTAKFKTLSLLRSLGIYSIEKSVVSRLAMPGWDRFEARYKENPSPNHKFLLDTSEETWSKFIEDGGSKHRKRQRRK
jgi:hypothetical protein